MRRQPKRGVFLHKIEGWNVPWIILALALAWVLASMFR